MMKRVVIPPIKTLLKPSPGFAKKQLARWKIDLLGLCEFGCRYCSSNLGNFLRIRREQFADLTEAQLGERLYPNTSPELAFHFPDVVEQLQTELAGERGAFGAGEQLMFSMLTDGFSPSLVHSGTTRAVLELLLERTSFRIRILTKNAVVGHDQWLRFFERRPDRFVVGLSTGTMNDGWARRVELGTSKPSARLRALRCLQDAGVPTYGMICPAFPDVLEGQVLEELLEAVRPHVCQHVWIEPYNDRANWRAVRQGYEPGSSGYQWLTDAFEQRNPAAWSTYAVQLYRRTRTVAEAEGWLGKLRFLLYEQDIVPSDVAGFGDLAGILLQSKPDEHGCSRHADFADVQRGVTSLPVVR